MDEQRTGTDRPDDAALLAELREMLDRVDPVPAWLEDLARLSYDLRTQDLEVAELVADSQVDRPAVAVRAEAAAAEPRLLSFEADGLLIDLQVSHRGRSQELAGQLVPGGRALVELRQPGRPVRRAEADELGRFGLESDAEVPFSLLVRRRGSAPVASTWLRG